jgi:hypothetical protein
MSKIKIFIGEQIIPADSPVTAYEKRIELGIETKKILGYYALIIQTGGLIPESCKATFSNASRTIFEPVGLGHLIVGKNVEIEKRFFMKEPFEVNGFLNVKTSIATVPSSDFVVQYILLAETV